MPRNITGKSSYCLLGWTTLFALTLLYYNSYSQQRVVVSGKILEAGTQTPVAFASIRLAHRSTGTSSNEFGEFVFKITDYVSGDSIVVSSIGYKNVRVAVSPVETSIVVLLEPFVTELQSVTVKAESALDLLKRSLEKIPSNYDTTGHHLMGFYRENTVLQDFQLGYNEAVLDIYRNFRTSKAINEQIRIVKGRKKKIDFGNDAQFRFWISGLSNGARGNLANDLVKYRGSKLSPFNPANFKYYTFSYGENTWNDDKALQVIEIHPAKKTRKGLFDMKIFIEEGSLAIVRTDVSLSPAGIRYTEKEDKGAAYSLMTLIVGATLDYHAFNITATYKPYKNKWYLASVMRDMTILVNSKKRGMKDARWHSDLNLQITDIDPENREPISEGNIGSNEGTMSSIISENYDQSFWENFNILEPVIPDSLKHQKATTAVAETRKTGGAGESHANHSFTRADSLRGALSVLRSCYDVTFYHLDAAIDMDNRSVSGSNLIRFEVSTPFNKMQVDLYANMAIDKILYLGKPLTFTREFDAVFITFPSELRSGTHEITIWYNGVMKTPDWSIAMNGGALWDKDDAGNPWVQMVCQGSGASLWWPNKDHLSDEPDSMKIWITVPSQYTEISNGRLLRKTPRPNNKTRYEWAVSYPINNYNVTFNIGKYAHFTDNYIAGDTLTIDYYVMPYNLERAKRLFTQVKPMLASYEKYFGKYPFPRDGFTLVESIYPMEHQGGVCIGKITEENSGETNPLLWHESAHEWWGNSVSCKDLADMWIHEAFASYAESLVLEYRFNKTLGQQFLTGQKEQMVLKEPVIGSRDVNDIFYNIEDMYSKGGLILNTLRNVIDDDTLWFDLLRDIQRNFRYKTITSDQLIAFINNKTETDYTSFFEQYLLHSALPVLETELKQSGKDLVVRYRWKADVENFKMRIKVTTAPEKFSFIYPEASWKEMTLKNMDEEEFEVDEGFLIGE